MGLFSTEPFDAAALRAEQEEKWLLIDFTAAWCGPCQNMEKTTWQDSDVAAWVAAKAVAVQVDVDAQQELAQRFGVQAMPTMVVVKGGVELDRAVGAQSAKQLLGWLDGLEQGKTLLDARREAASAGGPMERMRLAQELQARGKIEEAGEQALWVWEHALEHEPALAGMRYSFLVSLLSDLVFQLPRLQERLITLRDDAEAEHVDDFLALNRVLGTPERTLAWFERVKSRGQALLVHRDLIELLIERERWADIGRLFDNPTEYVESLLESRSVLKMVPDRLREQVKLQMDELFRREVAIATRALRASGRDREATQVVERALVVDPSDEMKRAIGG